MRLPIWLALAAGVSQNAFAGARIVARRADPDFRGNETTITATPIAPTAASGANYGACGGRTVNAPSARLFYYDAIQEITASTALDGSLCAENTYTSPSPARTDAPVAAATITVDVTNAPKPVATVTKTLGYSAQSTSFTYTKTFYSDVAVPTKKVLTAPVPALGFTMYAFLIPTSASGVYGLGD